MSLQIRRGTNAERTSVVFDSGEPVWTTDGKKLYIGDGTTSGGVIVSGTTTTINESFYDGSAVEGPAFGNKYPSANCKFWIVEALGAGGSGGDGGQGALNTSSLGGLGGSAGVYVTAIIPASELVDGVSITAPPVTNLYSHGSPAEIRTLTTPSKVLVRADGGLSAVGGNVRNILGAVIGAGFGAGGGAASAGRVGFASGGGGGGGGLANASTASSGGPGGLGGNPNATTGLANALTGGGAAGGIGGTSGASLDGANGATVGRKFGSGGGGGGQSSTSYGGWGGNGGPGAGGGGGGKGSVGGGSGGLGGHGWIRIFEVCTT